MTPRLFEGLKLKNDGSLASSLWLRLTGDKKLVLSGLKLKNDGSLASSLWLRLTGDKKLVLSVE